MKAILMSIHPEWVEEILSGRKTIEIRKTMPNCKLPIDVYIYVTKDKKKPIAPFYIDNKWVYKVYSDETCFARGCTRNQRDDVNGKVVAKFTLNTIATIHNMNGEYYFRGTSHLHTYACVNNSQLDNYLKGKIGFGFYISDLEIFDEPKELMNFYKVGFHKDFEEELKRAVRKDRKILEKYGDLIATGETDIVANHVELTKISYPMFYGLERAPQSWCYVEV